MYCGVIHCIPSTFSRNPRNNIGLSSEIYSFRKDCVFCKREIIMSNKEGKWHPYEITGDIHKCARRQHQPPSDVDV